MATRDKTEIIYIGTDHGGFEPKQRLLDYLVAKKYLVRDSGAYRFNKQDDYPEFGIKVAKGVQIDPQRRRGILLCRSGQGMAMLANRFKKIRAALIFNPEQAIKTRHDNDSNILVLAADQLTYKQIQAIVETWLTTKFSKAPRHLRRVKQMDKYGS